MKKFEGIRFLHFAQLSVVFTGSHSLNDVTSSRPRKTTIAFFADFGGIEKLFCVPDQNLDSKIMNQCNIAYEISFHRHFKYKIFKCSLQINIIKQVSFVFFYNLKMISGRLKRRFLSLVFILKFFSIKLLIKTDFKLDISNAVHNSTI